MEYSDQIIQYILSGLSNGSIYALIGFGFAIIYNATGIINFAQGEFVMLGGMLTIFFLNVFHLPLLTAIAWPSASPPPSASFLSGWPSGPSKTPAL